MLTEAADPSSWLHQIIKITRDWKTNPFEYKVCILLLLPKVKQILLSSGMLWGKQLSSFSTLNPSTSFWVNREVYVLDNYTICTAKSESIKNLKHHRLISDHPCCWTNFHHQDWCNQFLILQVLLLFDERLQAFDPLQHHSKTTYQKWIIDIKISHKHLAVTVLPF